jgi:hypothetical protein
LLPMVAGASGGAAVAKAKPDWVAEAEPDWAVRLRSEEQM